MDLEYDAIGGRRVFRRLEKMNAKMKMRTTISQEEDELDSNEITPQAKDET